MQECRTHRKPQEIDITPNQASICTTNASPHAANTCIHYFKVSACLGSKGELHSEELADAWPAYKARQEGKGCRPLSYLLYLFFSLSLSISPCLVRFIPICLLSDSLSICFSFRFSLSPFLSPSLSIPHSVSLFVSLSVCFSLSLSLSLFL